MRISDWSSDVCSSDLTVEAMVIAKQQPELRGRDHRFTAVAERIACHSAVVRNGQRDLPIGRGFGERFGAGDRASQQSCKKHQNKAKMNAKHVGPSQSARLQKYAKPCRFLAAYHDLKWFLHEKVCKTHRGVDSCRKSLAA